MLGPDRDAERQALADPATHTLWRQDIIRFADLDILGHVNNVAYMVFFETGRVAFLEQLGMPPRDREHGPGVGPPPITSPSSTIRVRSTSVRPYAASAVARSTWATASSMKASARRSLRR